MANECEKVLNDVITKRERRGAGEAKPLGKAGWICRGLGREVRVIDDAFWLDADPTTSSAVNTILVKKA